MEYKQLKHDYVITFLADVEVCGVLEYITLGNTAGVQTVSLPAVDDGLSDTVSVTFPMGGVTESQVQVRELHTYIHL